MIQRLNSTGHLFSTCAELEVEEHSACTCGCRVSESDCGHNQYFSANVCRCECTDREAIATCFLEDDGRGEKVWDPINCRCRCTESYRECSSGYIYDQTNTCRCASLHSIPVAQ